MKTAAMQSGLRESMAGVPVWVDEPAATGRCEVCGRLAYDHARLCKVCCGEMAYMKQVERLGVSRRCGETAESRALHRWMRRQERRQRAGAALIWAGFVLLYAATGYVVWQLGWMFLAWVMGW